MRKGPINVPYPVCSRVNHGLCLSDRAYLANPAAHTDVWFPDLTGTGKDSRFPQEATYSWGNSFKETVGEGGREPAMAGLARGIGTEQAGDKWVLLPHLKQRPSRARFCLSAEFLGAYP